MEISVSTGLYYTKNYENILDIIKRSGARNIELVLNQAFIDLPIEIIKEALLVRELNVTSIHLPLTFIAYERNEDEQFWMQKGIDYLNELDANILVSHFFYKKDDKNENNDEEHFRNIMHFTKESNKYICTENLPNIWIKTMHQDPTTLSNFLKDNNCYMTYDITHVATHGRDIIEDYKLYKDNIRNIHLSDFIDGHEHKLLGDGELPIKEFIKTLQDDKYKYPITLEFDFENPSRNKLMSDEEAVKAISNSIKYVEYAINE